MAKEPDRPGINPMVHPPIVALMFIVIAYFLGRFVPFPFVAPPIVWNIGLLMTFIGFLFGIGAFMEFRRVHTTLDPHGCGGTGHIWDLSFQPQPDLSGFFADGHRVATELGVVLGICDGPILYTHDEPSCDRAGRILSREKNSRTFTLTTKPASGVGCRVKYYMPL